MLKMADKYMALSLGCLLMVSACSEDEELSIPDNQGKTPIELSVGLVGESPAITRSVTTSNDEGAKAFPAGTSLYMVMKSEAGDNSTALYTRTIGFTQESASDSKTSVLFTEAYKRFWEDSYAVKSKLSVYSACVPGYYFEGTESVSAGTTVTGTKDALWTVGESTEYPNSWENDLGAATIAWPLRNAAAKSQTNEFISSQDLCFSNNVADVIFKDGKFGSGNLVYYHALTWITFKIKKGDGFTAKETFDFPDGENIHLKGFNLSGTFDIKEGEFVANTVQTDEITALAVTTDNSATSMDAYVLDALMVPGTDLTTGTKGDIEFLINNNQYKLSKEDLKKALATTDNALDENGKMRAGVHYVFTMTVGKKKMDSLTATLVDWTQVNADEMEPSNARILITLLDGGGTAVDYNKLNLFRSENQNTGSAINDDFESFDWATGYNSKANLVKNTKSSTDVYEAQTDDHAAWYWTDNNTFYHFRTVMPKTSDSWKVETETDSEENKTDFITLTAAADYTDVCWGAPFNTGTPPSYDPTTYGYDGSAAHQISKAIGPTEGTISIVMFHMMSDVTITLTTTTGGDKVTLDGATLELSGVNPTGKVLMGNGLVVPTGNPETVSYTLSDTNKLPWHYGFVPQSLENVVLTITTTDHNQYVIDMKDVKSGAEAIGRWLPNHKYAYTFKLTKSGIAKMTATLANWEEVEAGDDNVQIR